jgi:superfamily II RNA helicase
MEPTSSWVRGQRFADVLELNKDVFEGSMVRALRRIEELMGQVSLWACRLASLQYIIELGKSQEESET